MPEVHNAVGLDRDADCVVRIDPRWPAPVDRDDAGITPQAAIEQASEHRLVEDEVSREQDERRKRVEEPFGWKKTVGGLRKLRYIGRAANEFCAILTAAAYDLLRMAKLEAAVT